jgi:predicted Rdx family selenoprotein
MVKLCSANINTTAVTVVQTPVNWRTGSVKSNEIKLVLSSGQTWLLFFSEAVSFTYDISTMTMDAPFTGVLRAAILSEPKVSCYNKLLQHVPRACKQCNQLLHSHWMHFRWQSVLFSKHISFVSLHVQTSALCEYQHNCSVTAAASKHCYWSQEHKITDNIDAICIICICCCAYRTTICCVSTLLCTLLVAV